jgi:DNA-binding NarL/FixJ family response regulator
MPQRLKTAVDAFAGCLPLPLPPRLWNEIARELEFSPQQKRIVELILRNACDKQIAAALGRGKPTIRTHLDRVFRRLEVEDRGELVLLIFRMSHGLCS